MTEQLDIEQMRRNLDSGEGGMWVKRCFREALVEVERLRGNIDTLASRSTIMWHDPMCQLNDGSMGKCSCGLSGLFTA